jgi:nitrite reductase (NADH) small subunit
MTLTPLDPGASRRSAAVCRLADLVPERGVAALVDGEQVAIFCVASGAGRQVYAIDHHDPFSGANVLARGIVGSAGDRWYVASPVYKQRFDLQTGHCLDDDRVAVGTWSVDVVGDEVHVHRR